MNNEVKYYKDTIALTTTPQVVIDEAAMEFDTIRVRNSFGVDVILNFSENDTSGGSDFLVLAGEDFVQDFACTGRVSLSLPTGSASAEFFIRLTNGRKI